MFLDQWGRPCHSGASKEQPSSIVWWKRLRKENRGRDNFPIIGFKYLRKTAGDMIRKLSDSDTSSAFLSHADDIIERAYTNKDWEKLHAATDALRSQLFAAFDPPKMRLAV
jgi:hypothetical protein